MRFSNRIRSRTAFTVVLLFALIVVSFIGIRALSSGEGSSREASADAQIVVLLPLTGPAAVDWRTPLEWAIEAVNEAGGVHGKPLRARFIDTGQEDVTAAARRVASDPSVVGVIGPDSSQAVFAVAPLFIAGRKIMITPSATSGDLFRAFAGHAFFWRTVGSDISQLRAMLDLAARDGARRVALVTGSGLLRSDILRLVRFPRRGVGAGSHGGRPLRPIERGVRAADVRGALDEAGRAHRGTRGPRIERRPGRGRDS